MFIDYQVGTAAGLFYLYSNGHNHWLYNPVMYRLWTYADLSSAATLPQIIFKRLFWVAISVLWLLLTHLLFRLRRPTRLKRTR